jgi:hypothetical protein
MVYPTSETMIASLTNTISFRAILRTKGSALQSACHACSMIWNQTRANIACSEIEERR